MKIIHAGAGNSRYDIEIGESALGSLAGRIRSFSADHSAFVVSARVYEYHRNSLDRIIRDIPNAGLFLARDRERDKNFRYAENFLNLFIDKGLNRKSVITGIGGGVIGDFAGFLAALYMRGLPVIHVPTTLLAMVDSSIGGKAAVNMSRGKNMAGAFHQPAHVCTDTSFLTTLPDREWRNGISEILKHGLIGENMTLEILEKNDLESIKKEKVISKLIYLSAAFKAGIAGEDEKEGGLRAVLNFGHTAGHAIESLMNYRRISHGEAVALGIRISIEISGRMKWLSSGEIGRINGIIDRYRLAGKGLKIDRNEVISHMSFDKKNFSNRINFVLLKKIGFPKYNITVKKEILKDALDAVL